MRHVAATIALALVWPLPAAASGPAGTLICGREVKELRATFERRRQTFPQAEVKRIADQLALARSYCAAFHHPASVTMAGVPALRRELQGR